MITLGICQKILKAAVVCIGMYQETNITSEDDQVGIFPLSRIVATKYFLQFLKKVQFDVLLVDEFTVVYSKDVYPLFPHPVH